MKGSLLLWGLLSACTAGTNLPGDYLGSFYFTGQMNTSSGATTCFVDAGPNANPDAGTALTFPGSVSFYARLSRLDAGALMWQLLNAIPVVGVVDGGQFIETTRTIALVSGCNCAAALAETVTLSDDGGFPPGLGSLSGVVDDRLDPEYESDAGPVCGTTDAGVPLSDGCGLGCDLIYEISGVPQEPPGGY